MSYKFNPFTGTLDDVGPNNGNGVPGGSDTQVQFNDGGVFGGDVDFTYNKTSNLLTLGGDINLNDGGSFTTTLQCVTPTANRTISFPNATGTVGLVAGSSGQLVYNNAGAYAGVSTMTFDGTSVTLAGRLINSYTSVASSPAKVFTGTWFTGGTSTTTKPHLLIEPAGTTSTAWSTSGTALGVNAPSGFLGRHLDLQTNGTSVLTSGQEGGTYRLRAAGGIVGVSPGVQFDSVGAGGIRLNNDKPLGWSSSNSVDSGGQDTQLWRDSANVIGQRVSTNAQTFRVYNTYTSGTSYELGKLEWASNVFRIGTEKGSGGGTARDLSLHTDGTERMRITSDAYVRLVSGTGGIQFNGDTAAANALDDYEEGTFTPTVIGLTTAGTGTYSLQSGRYIKIGTLVFAEVAMDWSAHTGTGSMWFSGLPFTSGASSAGAGMIVGRINNIALTANNYLSGYQIANSANIALRQLPTGGGAEGSVPIDTAGAINFSICYSTF